MKPHRGEPSLPAALGERLEAWARNELTGEERRRLLDDLAARADGEEHPRSVRSR